MPLVSLRAILRPKARGHVQVHPAIHGLPNEITLLILEELDTFSLYHFSLTSRVGHRLTNIVFRQHIVMVGDNAAALCNASLPSNEGIRYAAVVVPAESDSPRRAASLSNNLAQSFPSLNCLHLYNCAIEWEELDDFAAALGHQVTELNIGLCINVSTEYIPLRFNHIHTLVIGCQVRLFSLEGEQDGDFGYLLQAIHLRFPDVHNLTVKIADLRPPFDAWTVSSFNVFPSDCPTFLELNQFHLFMKEGCSYSCSAQGLHRLLRFLELHADTLGELTLPPLIISSSTSQASVDWSHQQLQYPPPPPSLIPSSTAQSPIDLSRLRLRYLRSSLAMASFLPTHCNMPTESIHHLYLDRLSSPRNLVWSPFWFPSTFPSHSHKHPPLPYREVRILTLRSVPMTRPVDSFLFFPTYFPHIRQINFKFDPNCRSYLCSMKVWDRQYPGLLSRMKHLDRVMVESIA